MLKKILCKKNAGMGQFMVIIVAFISLLFFIAIFAGLSGILKSCSSPYKEEKVQALESKTALEPEANLHLLNFLRTPVKFEKSDLTVSDLIVLWAKNDYAEKYKVAILSEGDKIFNSIYGKNCFYLLISTDLSPSFVSGVSPFSSGKPSTIHTGQGSNAGIAAKTAPFAYIPYADKETFNIIGAVLDLTSYTTFKSFGYSESRIRQECVK